MICFEIDDNKLSVDKAMKITELVRQINEITPVRVVIKQVTPTHIATILHTVYDGNK